MKFKQVLNESGYTRLAHAAGGSATGEKVKSYLHKLDDNGFTSKIERQARKKGLTGKKAEAYKWAVMHKRLKGHF